MQRILPDFDAARRTLFWQSPNLFGHLTVAICQAPSTFFRLKARKPVTASPAYQRPSASTEPSAFGSLTSTLKIISGLLVSLSTGVRWPGSEARELCLTGGRWSGYFLIIAVT